MPRPRTKPPNAAESRLQIICEKEGFESIEELAAMAEIPAATLRKAAQRNSISKQIATSIHQKLGYPIGWVWMGERDVKLGQEIFAKQMAVLSEHLAPAPHLLSGRVEIDNAEFVSLPRFDAALSAGPGCILESNPTPLGFVLFEAQWIRALTMASPAALAVLQVDGDSMEDTLYDRDWILVDQSQTRLERPGIYALRVGSSVWVKRMELDLDSKRIRVISDNRKRYDPQLLNEGDLQIIGRVIWVVGRRL